MFFRQTMVQSGSVDILAALNWLAANGYVKSSDVPTQFEYGVEICCHQRHRDVPLDRPDVQPELSPTAVGPGPPPPRHRVAWSVRVRRGRR